MKSSAFELALNGDRKAQIQCFGKGIDLVHHYLYTTCLFFKNLRYWRLQVLDWA